MIKIRIVSLLPLFLLLFNFNSFSQNYIIGADSGSNASNTYPAAYGNWYWGARQQYIYYASELNSAGLTAGNIDGLGFYVASINSGTTLIDYTISMKNSPTTSLSLWESGMMVVLNPANVTPVLNWNMHNLNTSFFWDGTSNIIVEICFNNSSYIQNESTVWTKGFTNLVSRYYRADNSTVCSSTFLTATSTSRPVAQFMRLFNDVGVIGIDGPLTDCGLNSNETITVRLTNFGNTPESGFPITYVMNNGTPVTETYTGTINPQDTLTYVFSTIQDLSVKGRYVFDAYTSLVTDTMAANDGVDSYEVLNMYSQEICIYDAPGGNADCNSFTEDLCYDGYVAGPITATSSSFYIRDVALDSLSFLLYFTECNFQSEFSFYIDGVLIDSISNYDYSCHCTPGLFLEYPVRHTITDASILSSLDCGYHTIAVVNDDASGGMNTTGYTATLYGDCPSISASNDVGMVAVDAPISGCALTSSETIIIRIENLGDNVVSNIPVNYRLDGGVPITETYTGSINPGDTAVYSFSTTADLLSQTTYVLDAFTSLGADMTSCTDSLLGYDISKLIEIGVCIFDADGGSGITDCSSFSSDICADGYEFSSALHQSVQTNFEMTTIDSVSFNLYFTECNGPSDFFFYFNGVVIDTLTNYSITCVCSPYDYPVTYTITDTSVLSMLECGMVTLGVRNDNVSGGMNLGGYSASVYGVCPEQLNNDIGVIAFDSPVSGCQLGQSEVVAIKVKNYGTSAQSNFPIFYEINNGGPVIENYSGTILSGDTGIYSFTAMGDFLQSGIYEIVAGTMLPGDSSLCNDVLSYSISNPKIGVFPYREDIESFTIGYPGILENGWENDSLDTHDWYVHTGPTSSFATGPNGDHTTGLGNYLYLEASGYSNRTAILNSACADISGLSEPTLSFWYHMFGVEMGKLYVEIDTGSATWFAIDSIIGQVQTSSNDEWLINRIDLSPYPDMEKLRFRGLVGSSYHSDIAIDDIKIYEEHCSNGIRDIDEDQVDCGGEDCPTCPERFQIAYGGSNNDRGYGVDITDDGGYIVAGITESFGSGYQDVYLLRTDDKGNKLWTKTFGGLANDYGYDVISTQDGGFLVAGYTESFGLDQANIFLIKTDGSGNLVWSNTYSGTSCCSGQGSDDKAFSVKQTLDGGYVIGGVKDGWNAIILKINSSGVIEWTSGISTSSYIYDIEQAEDSSYYFTGYIYSSGDYDVLFGRAEKDGTIDTVIALGSNSGYDYGRALILTADGGYAISGHTNSFGPGGQDIYLIKLDSTYSVVISKAFGSIYGDYSHGMTEAASGDLVLSCLIYSVGSEGYGNYATLISVDGSGDTSWTKSYGRSDYSSEYKVLRSSDDGYVLVGTTNSFTNGLQDVYLVKTDSVGATNMCKESPASISIEGNATFDNSPSISYNSGLTEASASVVLSVDSTEELRLVKVDISGFTINDVSCFGQYNGNAVVNHSGGISPYSYNWTKLPSGYVYASQDSAYYLNAGYYSVKVYAGNTCPQIDTFLISQPSMALSSSGISIPANCYGSADGSIDLTPIGGTPPYTYSWNNGDVDEDPDSLLSGWYFVTLTDGNNCSASYYFGVSQPAQLYGDFNVTPVSCNGSSDGGVNLTVNNGLPPFNFMWSTGDITEDINGQSAGLYYITITDSTNCIVNDSVYINQPDSFIVNLVQDSVSCFGFCDGVASIVWSGGTPPYSVLWDDPSTQTTISATGLCIGSYTAVTTDNNGCADLDSIIVLQPSILTSTMSSTDVSCNVGGDGTATITVSGGSSPYTYSWNNGQSTSTAIGLFATNYSVNVFDANSCLTSDLVTISEPDEIEIILTVADASCNNADGSISADVMGGVSPYSYSWSSGGTASVDTALVGGSYSLIVSDANGCMDSSVANLPISAIRQEICIVTVDSVTSTMNEIVWEKPTVTNIDSFRIYRDISGVYTWVGSVPYAMESYFVDSTNGIDPKTTSYRYKISVLDVCGNEGVLSDYHETMHLQITYNGNIAQLSWDPYEGFDTSTFNYSILRDSTGTNNFETIGSVTNNNTTYNDNNSPTDADYLVEVVHPFGGCTADKVKNYNSSKSNTSSISGPGSLFSGTTTTSDANQGLCDGTATVIPSGGKTPYTYLWDGNTGSQTTETATNLCPGTYSVIVYDATGNMITLFATVNTVLGMFEQDLGQNTFNIYPNPYSGETQISYSLNEDAHVLIEVHNVLGEVIAVLANEKQRSGGHKYYFGAVGKGYANGVYFVELIVNGETYVKRIVELK